VVEKLKKSLLYTYGIADLGFVLMVNMEVYFFPIFLTDHAQFSLSLSGQILGITSLIDIVFALVAGVLLQKTTLKFGGKYSLQKSEVIPLQPLSLFSVSSPAI
jgi:Na+/melibiose symporter-like transporter